MFTAILETTPSQATRMFGTRLAAPWKFKFGIKKLHPFLYQVYFNDLEKYVHYEHEATTALSAIMKYHGYKPKTGYKFDYQYLFAERLCDGR